MLATLTTRSLTGLSLVLILLLAFVHPAQAQRASTELNRQALQNRQSRPSRVLPANRRLLSSYNCICDDGKPEHRVCVFDNLVLWEGQLIYVADGGELLPEIDINWLDPERLNVKVMHNADIPEAWNTAEVETVSEALLGHQVNYQNYYHVFIETLPTWHNIMCRYLGLCTYDPESSLQLWLLEDRGPGAYTDLSFRLPALQPLYACLSPHPLRHIKDDVNFGKLIIFKKALAGIGPDVRAFHQWRPRFFKNWVAPPAEMMHSWRHRLAECLQTPFDTAEASIAPLTVTIVDRPYKAGRHILNVQEVQSNIKAKWEGSVVRVVHIEGMDLRQQIALFQHTSILIWTHGAAMADLLFLPQGAGAVELVPWPHADQAHEWAQSIQSDFSLPMQVAWTRLSDVSNLHYHTEVLFKQATWQMLDVADRLAFLENGTCPGAPFTPLNLVCRNEWMHYLVSYVQPWLPLETLLDTLHAFVQSHALHVAAT